MNLMDDVDFTALTCLEDFDVEDTFEQLLNQPVDVPPVKEEGAPRAMPPLCFVRSKRHRHHGAKRSFKDYTKPIKRGFLNRQIPANDIRRSLASLVICACNAHDPVGLATVLREFCISSVVLTSRFIGNCENHPVKNAVMHREIHGVPHITAYLDALFQAVPDALLRLLDTKVHMFQNGCSYIVGKFTFKGAKCFDLLTLGDTKAKRTLPSKFDRRAAAARSQAQAQGQSQLIGEQATSFAFDQLGEGGAGLSDLESFLFDDVDGDDDFNFGQQPLASSTLSASQLPLLSAASGSKLPQTMSVALENKPIQFVVPHSAWEVDEVPLSFLGTIAFYLDPDAKIFKIEVLNTVESKQKDCGHGHKKSRRC